MGIIASNSYLLIFSAGTIVGAASTCIIFKLFSKKIVSAKTSAWTPSMEGKFEVLSIEFLEKSKITFNLSLMTPMMSID